jgi:hypothetical protein
LLLVAEKVLSNNESNSRAVEGVKERAGLIKSLLITNWEEETQQQQLLEQSRKREREDVAQGDAVKVFIFIFIFFKTEKQIFHVFGFSDSQN